MKKLLLLAAFALVLPALRAQDAAPTLESAVAAATETVQAATETVQAATETVAEVAAETVAEVVEAVPEAPAAAADTAPVAESPAAEVAVEAAPEAEVAAPEAETKDIWTDENGVVRFSTDVVKGKVKDIVYTTGIFGFLQKEAPDWVTQGYTRKDGVFVPGHEVKMLFGMSYGVGQLVMVFVCLVLIYLAIVKGFEPLLLLPIGLGGLLANLPLSGITAPEMICVGQFTGDLAHAPVSPGGFLYYIFSFGIDTGLFPILIFMGVGAMTDFGPLIANPRMALLGGAAQFGIFTALLGAVFLDKYVPGIHFGLRDAASIGIIGGADGPTAIWLTSKLAPDKLGAIAVAAYSYMALVPIIQPPIMRALTTDAERRIKMPQLRPVKKIEKVLFPIIVIVLCGLLLPSAVPLMGALMFGNLAKECGCVDRISDTMQNALCNIVTICLGISVGSKLAAEKFVTGETLGILILGCVAFMIGTAAGVLMAKLMNRFSKNKINPLCGSAGVSAVPMAARVANKVGLESDPTNFLLMNAMGPNVAGVIGSAVAAGLLFCMLS